MREVLSRHRPDLLALYGRVLFDAEFRRSYEAQLRERVRQAAGASRGKLRLG